MPNDGRSRTPGSSSDIGAKYELRVATYIAVTLSEDPNVDDFNIFTNLAEAHPFDDVVARVRYKGEDGSRTYAIQVKHRQRNQELDLKVYREGYEEIFKGRGLMLAMNVPFENTRFCYFCNKKIKCRDYALQMRNQTNEFVLPFKNYHKLSSNSNVAQNGDNFLEDFDLYLDQPDNNRIKRDIRATCKITDATQIIKYVEEYFEISTLAKQGLRKGVFEAELLKIRLANYIVPLTISIEVQEQHARIWNDLTLRYDITVVKKELNIEHSLFGCIAQRINDVLDGRIRWNQCIKTDDGQLDVSAIETFKKYFKVDKSRSRHWIKAPTTLKYLIIELWICGEVPLIVQLDGKFPIPPKISKKSKGVVVISDLETSQIICDDIQLKVFTNIADIDVPELRKELLGNISISMQGRQITPLDSIIGTDESLMQTFTCSGILHLMKRRKAYLKKECLEGSHFMIFIISDSTSSGQHNLDDIRAVGNNIKIRCQPIEVNNYVEAINNNPKFKGYTTYCLSQLCDGHLELMSNNKHNLRYFFLDEYGESVCVLSEEPVPIIGQTLSRIEQNHINRFIRKAVIAESFFDSKKDGICLLSGEVNSSKLLSNKNIIEMRELIEKKVTLPPDKISFIRLRNEDESKRWEELPLPNCPVLRLHISSDEIELLESKGHKGLNAHISYSKRIIPEDDIFNEITSKAVVITGEPGMGKTHLLQSMFEANYNNEQNYFIFCNLAEYSQYLKKSDTQLSDNPLDFILERINSSQNNRYKEFRNILGKRTEKLILFLDSFDEVIPAYKKEVLAFIKILINLNIKIIIASRTIASHLLIENFQVQLFKIDALGNGHCLDYVQHWQLSAEELKNVPSELLKNPLHLNFLKIVLKGTLTPLTDIDRFSLYDRVTDIKVDEYFAGKEAPDQQEIEEILLLHEKFALMKMLGMEEYRKLLHCKVKFELSKKLRLGIITHLDNEGSPVFIHETFAEYLVAKWFTENMNEDFAKEVCQRMLNQNKIYIFEMISENVGIHKAILDRNIKQVKKYADTEEELMKVDRLGRTALHFVICCMYTEKDSYELFKILKIIIKAMRKHTCDFDKPDSIMEWTWFQYVNFEEDFYEYTSYYGKVASLETYLNAKRRSIENSQSNDVSVLSQYSDKLFKFAVEHSSISIIRDLIFTQHHTNLKLYRKDSEVEFEIPNAVPLDSKLDCGLTYLHIACIYNNLRTVEMAVELQNNLNVLDRFGCAPMHYCFMSEPKERSKAFNIIKILLESEADVNIRRGGSYTPLHLAVVWDDLDIVKMLLEKGADPNSCDKRGNDVLSYAAEKGQVDIVKMLLGNGADPNNCNGDGYSTLLEAVLSGALDIVKMLLEKGADPNNCDGDGRNVLSYAAHVGQLDIVKMLLENGADPNNCDEGVRSALSYAVKGGELDIVKMLLENGADPNNCDEDGRNALWYAVHDGQLDVVKMLLENGADPNDCDEDRRNALSYAVVSGVLDIVNMLLEKGADPNNCDYFGRNVLSFATKSGQLEIVKMLLENGADPNKCDGYRWNVLSYAVEEGQLDVVKMLLEKGANPNNCDCFGRNVLLHAAAEGKLDIVKVLLESGADPNNCDEHGRNVLSYAAESGQLDIVKMLLENGADLNNCDKGGRSVLSYAVGSGKLDIAKMLLENGADPNNCDEDRRNVL